MLIDYGETLLDCTRDNITSCILKVGLFYSGTKNSLKRVNGHQSPIDLTQRKYDFVRSGLFYEQLPAMSRPPKSKLQINEAGKCIRGKYSLLNDIKRWHSCSGVPRGCVS